MAVGSCCWIYGWESNTQTEPFDSLALLWCVNEVQQAQDHINLRGLISVCNEMPAAPTSKPALIQIIFWKALCILRQLLLGITVTRGGDDGRGGDFLMLIPSVPVQYSFWVWFPKGGALLSPTAQLSRTQPCQISPVYSRANRLAEKLFCENASVCAEVMDATSSWLKHRQKLH